MDGAKRDEYQDQLSRLLAARERLGAIRNLERRNGRLSSEEHAEARECHETIRLLDGELKSEGVIDNLCLLTPEALSLDLRKA
jgi:hypothetical protein